MDFNVELNLEPETSMDYALYDCLPPELVVRIDSYLSFEDSLQFQVFHFNDIHLNNNTRLIDIITGSFKKEIGFH